jgi:hypothetical protein
LLSLAAQTETTVVVVVEMSAADNSTVSSSSSSWLLSDLFWPLIKRVGDRWFEAKQQMPPSTEFEIWSLVWLFVFAGGVVITCAACVKARETLYRGRLVASLEDKED